MLDWQEIILRLGAATIVGAVIGLNRDLHHKSAGLRTLGLVALVSAAITLGTMEIAAKTGNTYVVTQVVQGLLTGVGFLGAGVIVRGNTGKKVHGLTTAASVWCSTGLGALCAYGLWPLIILTSAIALLLLTVGGPIEKWLHRELGDDDEPSSPAP